MKYTVPAGRVEIQPYLFTQDQWKDLEGVKSCFWKNARAARSLLNEVSERVYHAAGESISQGNSFVEILSMDLLRGVEK